MARLWDGAAVSAELTAAMRLLDEAKAQGFVFTRIAPGEDAPLLGVRETVDFVDEIVLTGCSLAEVSGDALTVLHTVVTEWEV